MSVWEQGYYQGKPISGRYTESKQKGTLSVEVTFDVMGHKKVIHFYLSEKAEEKSMRLLAELGFNNNWEAMAFADVEVELQCKHEEYNNKTQERWNFWGANQSAPIDINKAKSLSARFKSVAGPAVPRPTSPPVMPKGKMSDDELNAKWLEIIENINPKDAAGWHKVCEVFSIPF